VPHAERTAAYDELLSRYRAPLRRLAHAYTRADHEREDLFQEIALALWTALPLYRGDASERTFVYRVAHNTAIRFATKRAWRARHEQQVEVVREPASEANPEGGLIDQQRRDRLWAAVRELPLPDRQVMILHLEGLAAADIASISGFSAGNVATRLSRTRHRLAKAVRGEPR
jgi:RNA polymerase sigma-70 factor (ECF subfamily)